MFEAYMNDVSKDISYQINETKKSKLKVVYSAMHGVGCPFVKELCKRIGFTEGCLMPGKLFYILYYDHSNLF